jgi:predicted nucleic acid-binding protein
MNTNPLVVADTTPLNYLVLIGRAEILGGLFEKVLVPRAVWQELHHQRTPAAVGRWAQAPPAWLEVLDVQHMDNTLALGAGENEAISLALEQQAGVVLLDERKGRAAAQARGLLTLGTLNLIDLADEEGLLDGARALDDLRQTSFRAKDSLFARFEATMRERRLRGSS